MEVIGLTGGIAAGKTTVARRLAEHGAIVIDADLLAREAVAPGSPGLAAIRERFGPTVVDNSGHLNREALGALVFTDPKARTALNDIVHPEVGRLYRARLTEIAALNPEAIVVYDVPLLAEARSRAEFSRIVVVDAPERQRVERLMRIRGMTESEARSRVAAQASDDDRRAIADDVIDSSGTIESTIAQTDALWSSIVDGARAQTSSRVSDPSS